MAVMNHRPDKPARVWAELHELNPVLFPSLLELSRDKGPIGQVLRRMPEWILNEAGRWPDPWKFLCGVHGVSPINRSVFEAAASATNGRLHLIHIAKGTATLNADWEAELRQARGSRNPAMIEHATRKCFTPMWQYEDFRADVENVDESIRDEFHRRGAEVHKELVKRGRRAEAERGNPLPGDATFQQFRLELTLVEWWVRQGVEGVPGFMFWRNETLTKFLYLCSGGRPQQFVENRDRRCNYVKYVRQQLGLIPVGGKTHFVWRVSIKANSDGDYEVEGLQRNGEKAFSGIIPAGRFPPVRLSALTAH